MALTYVGAGAQSVSQFSVTPVAPAGIADGDTVLLFAISKLSAANIPTPSGWTLVHQGNYGTGSDAAGTGLVKLSVFSIVKSGTLTMPTLTTSGTGSVIMGRTLAFRPTSGYTLNVITEIWNKNFAGTSWGNSSTTLFPFKNGDFAGLFVCGAETGTWTNSGFSNATPGSGVSFGASTEVWDAGTSTGNDAMWAFYRAPVTVSGGNGVAKFTSGVTSSPSTAGGLLFMQITEDPQIATYDGAVSLSASGVMGAGGVTVRPASTTLIANASLNAGTVRIQSGTSSLSAVANTVLGSAQTHTSLVSLSAESSLSAASPVRTTIGIASLTASANFTAAAIGSHFGAVTLSVLTGFSASSDRISFVTVSLESSASFSSSAVVSKISTVSLIANTTMSATASLITFSSVSLSAIAFFTADPITYRVSAVELVVESTMAASAVRVVLTSVSLNVETAFAASSYMGRFSTVSLTVEGSMNVGGVDIGYPVLVLEAVADFSSEGTQVQFVSLGCIATFEILAERVQNALAAMNVSTSIMAAAAASAITGTNLVASASILLDVLRTTPSALSLTVVGQWVASGGPVVRSVFVSLEVSAVVLVGVSGAVLGSASLVCIVSSSFSTNRVTLALISMNSWAIASINSDITFPALVNMNVTGQFSGDVYATVAGILPLVQVVAFATEIIAYIPSGIDLVQVLNGVFSLTFMEVLRPIGVGGIQYSAPKWSSDEWAGGEDPQSSDWESSTRFTTGPAWHTS